MNILSLEDPGDIFDRQKIWLNHQKVLKIRYKNENNYNFTTDKFIYYTPRHCPLSRTSLDVSLDVHRINPNNKLSLMTKKVVEQILFLS